MRRDARGGAAHIIDIQRLRDGMFQQGRQNEKTLQTQQ
jgi:hypothetical protein